MPRPTNKTELVDFNATEYEALEKLIADYPPERLVQPGALGEWSAKDTLAHLHEWHNMVMTWYDAGLRGESVPVPAAGYTWMQIPALNQRIYETYRDMPLEEILAKFRASHRATQEIITGLSEADLFARGLYPWMRQNNLAAYFTSNCCSHYRWARTELRKGLKKLA